MLMTNHCENKWAEACLYAWQAGSNGWSRADIISEDNKCALSELFNIDNEICQASGGAMKVVACIEDPVVIRKILTYLEDKALSVKPVPLPESRAPPQARLFD